MNDKKPEKTEREKMQDLLYNFTVLHENWADEEFELRQQISKAEELSDKFIEKVNELENLSTTIKKDVTTTLNAIGEKVNTQAIFAVAKALGHEVSYAVGEIKTAAINSQRELDKWKKQAKSGVIWVMLTTMITAFLVSLATVKFLLPEPKLALTDKQASFLTGGQIIARIYPKLLPKEQKHLQDLIDEYAQDLLQAREATETQK